MKPKILYIMSSYNISGGTPKKTLDLMKYFGENSILYIYTDAFNVYKKYLLRTKQINEINEYERVFENYKSQFLNSGGKIYEGFYGSNFVKHAKALISIVDEENIDLVQTQFFKGEILGFLIKIFRPKIKLILAFVSAVPSGIIKSFISKVIYKRVDAFIFISNYVKNFWHKKYPSINNKYYQVIYNGTFKRENTGENLIKMKNFSVLCVGALIKLKNIQVLIKAFNILINEKKIYDLHLYIAGEGAYKDFLLQMVSEMKLKNHINFIGNQTNIGGLLEDADIFVHPSYNEGFGIAVAEAMHAEKPIIVSNAGALPELIKDGFSGLVADPYKASAWADAILTYKQQPHLRSKLSKNAYREANNIFTIKKFYKNHQKLYVNILNN